MAIEVTSHKPKAKVKHTALDLTTYDLRLVTCSFLCATGIGMSLQEQQRLFQSFAQAEGLTAREYGGVGPGLVITKQLVQLMKAKWV